MKKGPWNWLGLVVLLLGMGSGLLLSGGSAVTAAQQPKFAVFAGGWEPPPAYHGNPAAPGGVGVAWWFVYEPLFVFVPLEPDPAKQFLPRLAESWEETPTTLTVRLRSGLRWHDGQPLTSRDVALQFKRFALFGWSALPPFLADIETPDAQTVRFVWKKPFALAKQILASEVINQAPAIFGQFAARTEELFERWRQGEDVSAEAQELLQAIQTVRPPLPVGNGPFRMVQPPTEAEMRLVKFDDHYAAGNIRFDELRLIRWRDNPQMWAELQAGNVDAAHPAGPPEVAQQILGSQPGMRLKKVTDLGEFVLAFNHQRWPFSDVRFRKAIADLLDREQVALASLPGASEPVTVYAHGVLKSFESQWLGDALPGLTSYERDEAKATGLLEELGFRKEGGRWVDAQGSPLKVEVLAPAPNTDWVLAAENIATQLAAFGIDAQASAIEGPLYWDRRLPALDYDVMIEFGPAWWGTAHPFTGYHRIYGVDGWLRPRVGLFTAAEAPEGRTPTLPDWVRRATESLSGVIDPLDQKALVVALAAYTNANVTYLPFLEKQLMIFHLEGKRVTGWPAPEDPLWSLAPGAIERLYSTLIILGILQPAP